MREGYMIPLKIININRMKKIYLLLITLLIVCTISCTSFKNSVEPVIIERVVVCQQDGYFMGWPANNGIWMWKDGEIMVGFTRGQFVIKSGSHNIDPPHESMLARSYDGGFSWHAFKPKGFVGDSSLVLKDLKEPLNFMDENFALRIVGVTYHGSKVPEGGFFYSYDRGNSWEGPFAFKGFSDAEELGNMEITGRTEYLVVSKDSALLFLGAMKGLVHSDKPFVAQTTDGGLSFEFLGWIVDTSKPFRAIMPDAVKTFTGK